MPGKPSTWYGGLGRWKVTEKMAFYVGGAGASDANAGTDPIHPLLTVTHALDLCTADMDDHVIVAACSVANEAIWPIVISKAKVHIVGSNFYRGRAIASDEDTLAFRIMADKVEIAGLKLAPAMAHACIEMNDAANKRHLSVHHCEFVRMNRTVNNYDAPAVLSAPT